MYSSVHRPRDFKCHGLLVILVEFFMVPIKHISFILNLLFVSQCGSKDWADNLIWFNKLAAFDADTYKLRRLMSIVLNSFHIHNI